MTPEQKEEARRIAMRRMNERIEFWRQHDLRLASRGMAENPTPTRGRRSFAMRIEMRALPDIRPYENNPRVNDAAVDGANFSRCRRADGQTG